MNKKLASRETILSSSMSALRSGSRHSNSAVVLDGMERARQIEDELGGNTGDLMASFEGLPDTVQHAARLALAEPERRIELLQSLTDSEHEQLAQWLSGLTPAEHAAVEKALGLA